ncbi:MAG: hypothetical protein K2F63_04550, partial [Muribaculaceae bacterium]|nr:hypothetical protein [Muribaculaceae bacterium]
MCISDTNPRTHLVANESEVRPEWFDGAGKIGICGATSTPRWLMEKVGAKTAEIL